MSEYKYVPVEPTEEMHIAARDWSRAKYGRAIGKDASDGCYKAMLAAVPEQPAPAESDKEAERNAALDAAENAVISHWVSGATMTPIVLVEAIRALKSQPSQPMSDCDPVIFKDGASIGLFDIKKEVAEAITKGIASATGARVDWHYIAGRVHIKALPAQPVENESEIILNWLIRHMSASELQRIGIPCPPGCTIDDIKQSMKQWKPGDKPAAAQPSDTEILDWCEKYHADVTERKQGKWEVIWFSDNESHKTEFAHPTPREAIIAAMQADREGS